MEPQATPTPDAEEPPATPAAGGAAPRPPRSRGRTAVAGIVAIALVGVTVIGLAVTRPWVQTPVCAATAATEHPEWTVARRWDEALLDAIRRALPNPPVHARNLFHTSVAMWDAWAAYDPTASGYIVKEKHTASDMAAARNEAISYAAYRVLTSRFLKAVGGADSVSEFADVMDTLCYPLDVADDRRRHPGRARQPDRGRRPRLRPRRRLEPGERLCRAGLQAGQPAAGRRQVRHHDDRSEPLAAAPARAHDLPERDPGRERRPAGGRAALGSRQGLRAPGRRRRRASDRSRVAATARRPGDRPGVQGPGRRGHPRQQPSSIPPMA